MHALNILSLNVNGLDSAVKRARVLEYLHRGSIFCALIQDAYLICGTGSVCNAAFAMFFLFFSLTYMTI